MTATLSSPTELDLEQWLGEKLSLPDQYAIELRSAGYQVLDDLLGASDSELSDLVVQSGMKPPEARKLRNGVERENKKRQLSKKNADMIKELEHRIVIKEVLAGSIIVIFDVLPPSENNEQVIDDEELFS
eukprot:COSAG02_NODE_33747_length_495_cov_0.911616_1_plen_129_part_01